MTEIPDINALLKLARQPDAGKGSSVRVALLADTATQLLAGSLKGFLRLLGQSVEVIAAEFDQIEMQVMDPASALHEFAPQTVIVYLAAERIAVKYGTLTMAERGNLARDFAERVRGLHQALSARGYQIIFFNLADPGDGIFGNYGNKVDWSLQTQIRLANVQLSALAQKIAISASSIWRLCKLFTAGRRYTIQSFILRPSSRSRPEFFPRSRASWQKC